MSAPHVAGLAAILMEANPTLGAAEVEDILEDSAYKFGDPDEYVADPYNPDDGASYRAGHGLVDAVGAVSLALRRGTRHAPSACPRQVSTSVALTDGTDALPTAPQYDITRVEANWPDPGDVVTVDVHLADLAPRPGGGTDLYNLELQVDGEHIEVFYEPGVIAPGTTSVYSARWMPTTDVAADAHYDADNDLIRFTIRLGDSFTKQRLGGLGAFSNATLPYFDFVYGACTIWRSAK
jgi:hypothetical protein